MFCPLLFSLTLFQTALFLHTATTPMKILILICDVSPASQTPQHTACGFNYHFKSTQPEPNSSLPSLDRLQWSQHHSPVTKEKTIKSHVVERERKVRGTTKFVTTFSRLLIYSTNNCWIPTICQYSPKLIGFAGESNKKNTTLLSWCLQSSGRTPAISVLHGIKCHGKI